MEWYKFANEDVLVMVMDDSKQPTAVVDTLRMFANKLEARILREEGDS